jgi:hypothetical protein
VIFKATPAPSASYLGPGDFGPAAGVLGETVADRENDEKLPANGALPG